MKVVKPGGEHGVPRGVLGGAEISQATTGAHNIYMGVFRVPPGARSRPHYHANCGARCTSSTAGCACPGATTSSTRPSSSRATSSTSPRETHIIENRSETEPADYVVARNSPHEDSVEVPWAG